MGKLLVYLQKKGLEKKTIIMFTSDNGLRWEHSNDPLWGENRFNYEEGARVSFIAR